MPRTGVQPPPESQRDATTGPAAGMVGVGLSPVELGRLVECAMLHSLLHELLAAVAPLWAGLAAMEEQALSDRVQRRELFASWRPCQQRIYRLIEFAEGLQWTGPAFVRDARQLRGAPWAVSVAGLQIAIEDALSDPRPCLSALMELVDDLRVACYRHQAIANREIQGLAKADMPGLSRSERT